jgi:hypothetical protein
VEHPLLQALGKLSTVMVATTQLLAPSPLLVVAVVEEVPQAVQEVRVVEVRARVVVAVARQFKV